MAGITSTKKIKGQPHLLAYITPDEVEKLKALGGQETMTCLLYTSPSPRDGLLSRMPSSA